MNTAKYVVFDGMDGCGKGTQIKLLQDLLGDTVVFTREPGGTPFAEEIRKIVRDNPLAGESTALNNFLLFWAAREELQENLVVPTLEAGKHVFSDRGDSSTYAFQLHGEVNLHLINLFTDIRHMMFSIRHRRAPDLYIFFDLPAEESRERALQDLTREQTHFDVRDIGYYRRVSDGFHEFAKKAPAVFIDATQTREEVHRQVLMTLVTKMIIPELCVAI